MSVIAEPLTLAEMGQIGDLFTGHLQRVDHFLMRTTASAWAGYEFRTGAIGALSLIVANPGMSQNDIVKHTTFDKAAVNAIVNNLEELGWAERRKVPTDRRRHALHATAAGKKALKTILGRVKEIETRLLAGLSASDQELLRNLLDKAHDSCVKALNKGKL